jgi:integrase/recombinase XerD
MKLSDALNYYKTCARAEGKSPDTISWMEEVVKCFGAYLGEDAELKTITCDVVRGFIAALQKKKAFSGHRLTPTQERVLSPATVANRTRGLKTLFSFLEREMILPENPLKRLKVPKSPIKEMPTFSERELEKLMGQPDKKSNMGYRDYAIMMTLLDTTVRVSELTKITLADLDLEEGEIRIMGKGAKERFVPIGAKLSKVLLRYRLMHRPKEAVTDRLFTTEEGGPVPTKRVQHIVKEHGRRAGVKTRCSPHTFRSTGTVLFIRHGGGEFAAQKRLGHTSLTMTRRYASLGRSDVKRQHLAFGIADKLNI